jgi:hypothetical protein
MTFSGMLRIVPRRLLGPMRRWGIGIVLAGLLVGGHAAAATPTRSCGYDPHGIGIQVRASAGVTCSLAKKMMEDVLLGSHACYPHGYTAHPTCVLFGFNCSAVDSQRSHRTYGRCTRGRRLALGVAGP